MGKQPMLHRRILTERYLSTINQMGPRQATLLTLEYMSFCESVQQHGLQKLDPHARPTLRAACNGRGWRRGYRSEVGALLWITEQIKIILYHR